MGKVLVLDADERAALAVTRSLGSKGVHVVTADSRDETLAGASRFSAENFSYPSPYVDEDGFVRALCAEIVARNITMVIPVSEVTTRIILCHRDEFGEVFLPIASPEAFELVNDRVRLLDVARKLGVPVPESRLVRTIKDLRRVKGALSYPVVLKPACSRVFLDGEWVRASVRYASSESDIEKVLSATPYLRQAPFLVQEYVPGEGRGVFALYEDGSPWVFFAHRRIRENPPSGGVSVLSESVVMDPELEDYARRLLGHVKWHGVAMVEFKVTDQGRPYLMEINGRFWGSLQLAVSSGVDFPFLLYSMARGEAVEPPASYAVGTRNRWILGDVDHLYYRLIKRIYRVGSLREALGVVGDFMGFFRGDTKSEVLRRGDMGPFRLELSRTLAEARGALSRVIRRRGRLTQPHSAGSAEPGPMPPLEEEKKTVIAGGRHGGRGRGGR